MKQKYNLQGMTCAACQASVERAVKKLGAEKVNVSLLTNSMDVETDISEEEIIKAVRDAGYEAIPKRDKEQKNIKQDNPKDFYDNELNKLRRRLYVSVPLMIILMIIAMGHMVGVPIPDFMSGHEGAGVFALAQLIITIPIVYVNRAYFVSGFKALFNKNPNMDTLVAIGATAAVIYGIFATFMIVYGLGIQDHDMIGHYMHDLYFEAATMILTLITVGKYLEMKSKAKTTESINKLIDMQPDEVTILVDGREEVVSLANVNQGDLIKVVPGERIAVDGILDEGSSSIDTSAITGESMPVDVKEGDKLLSGSVNNTGSFTMRATSVGTDSTISKIITLMEEASATKAPISQLADRISSVFVPIVIAIAALSFIVWMILGAEFTFAFSIAIGILVISCPCALGLATPVAMMVANGKAAEHGILVKNSESLELLHKIDTIVFDKTGTITKGKPVVTDISLVNDQDKNKVLSLIYSLEENSEHPLSKAIKEYAKKENIEYIKAKNFDSMTGMGIKAEVDGKTYYAGNDKLLSKYGPYSDEIKEEADKYSSQGKTSILLFDEKEILAVFAIADAIKETSVDAIKDINSMGIKTIMLTGDNEKTAKEIAKNVGIEEFRAELLPQDKDKVITNLQTKGEKVAMVGDGINDAPSLMRADVGIGIADGTDIAIESADLVLIKSNLEDIVSSIKLSAATIKNIKQNLFWAFFYNVISIPIAMGIFYPAFGIRLNPMIGALAMSLSSVFVVTNSLRLQKFKIDNKNTESKIDENTKVNYNKINIQEREKNMKNITLDIKGMNCMHCKMAVEKALKPFAQDVEVSLSDEKAYLRVDEDYDIDRIKESVSEAGYEVVSIS